MDAHNPFGGGGGGGPPSSRPLSTVVSTPNNSSSNNLAAARLASMRPAIPSTNPVMNPVNAAHYAANPFMNPNPSLSSSTTTGPPPIPMTKSSTVNTNNPFPVVGQGQPHPQSLAIPPSTNYTGGSSGPNMAVPVQTSTLPPTKTIQDYVQEYLNGPQVTSLALSTVSLTPHLPLQNAPSPFTMTTYSIGLPVMKTELLVPNTNDSSSLSLTPNPIDPPPSKDTTVVTVNSLPSLANVTKALHQQQYGRILTILPPTSTLLSFHVSSSMDWTTFLGYVRCRIAALFTTKKYSQALTEINTVLVQLHENIVSSVASAKPDSEHTATLTDTCCTWLYLYGENLAYNGYWRESIVILHGLVRYFMHRLIPVTASRTTNANDSIFASWGTENTLAPLLSTASSSATTTTNLPVCEQLLSYLHVTMNTQGLQTLGKARCSYYLTSCAIKCAEILAGVGYTVAARNIYTETLEAYDTLYTTKTETTVWNTTNVTEIDSTVQNIQCTLPSWSYSLPSYLGAVYQSPVAFFHGLLVLSHIQLLRAMNKETDITSHLETLEAVPFWKGAVSTSPLPTIEQIKSFSVVEAYACTLVCQLRATILAQNLRLTEAFPWYELALYGCSRIVLSTSTNRTNDTGTEYPVKNVSALVSSVTYLSPIPDPYDTMNDLIIAIVDCVRRGPPAGALPPSSIALDFLHACVRSQPLLLGRPTTTIATLLGTLLETSRDPATALLAKRVIQGVAVRYGMQHIENSVYRLN